MRKTFALTVLAATLLMPLSAAAALLDGPDHMTASLSIAGRHVLSVAPVGHFGARERALEIERRLTRLLREEKPTAHSAQPTGIESVHVLRDIKVAAFAGMAIVYVKGVPLATVTPADARHYGRPAPEVARVWAYNLTHGLLDLKESGVRRLEQAMRQVDVAYGGEPVQGPERMAYRIARREVRLDEI